MASNVTDLEDLRNRLDVLQKTLAENNDSFFLCSMAVIIFSRCPPLSPHLNLVMQCGFAFLEAGAVRSKNTTNILIKNLLDSSQFIISRRIDCSRYCHHRLLVIGLGFRLRRVIQRDRRPLHRQLPILPHGTV